MSVGNYASDRICSFAYQQPWLVLDTANHGLQWLKGVNHLEKIVNGQFLVYAFTGGLKSGEDVLGCMYNFCKVVAGRETFEDFGEKLSHTAITVCDFVANTALSVSVLADLKIMKAVPGLSTVGNFAGILSNTYKLAH